MMATSLLAGAMRLHHLRLEGRTGLVRQFRRPVLLVVNPYDAVVSTNIVGRYLNEKRGRRASTFHTTTMAIWWSKLDRPREHARIDSCREGPSRTRDAINLSTY